MRPSIQSQKEGNQLKVVKNDEPAASISSLEEAVIAGNPVSEMESEPEADQGRSGELRLERRGGEEPTGWLRNYEQLVDEMQKNGFHN